VQTSKIAAIPLCRIGERVFLSAGRVDDALVTQIAAAATRELQLAAGSKSFRLYQMPAGFEPDALPGLPDWQAMTALANLTPVECAALVKSLFGTGMRMLRMEADPVLIALALSIMETPSLPQAKVALDVIAGYDTGIATIASRSDFAAGDALVSLSAGRLVIGRVESVHGFLARDNTRQRLAPIAFSGVPEEGRLLLAGDAGLALVEVKLHRHENAEAFHAEYARTNPDFIDLYSLADDAAGVILDRLGRQAPAHPRIDEPAFGLQFALETAIPLANGLFASGWFHDPDSRIETVVAVDHVLLETEVSAAWKAFDGRGDFGGKLRPIKRFVVFLPGKRPAVSSRPIPLRVRLRDGEDHLVTAQSTRTDLVSCREAILGAIAGYSFTDEMLVDVFTPALAPIQEALNARQHIRHVKQFGQRSARSVSLVIPLYKETGFIRSQVMAFAVDPFVRQQCEIVYVLDDPLIDGTVTSLIEGLAISFPLDLKLVTLDRNGGYALANNMGVDQSDGEVLVLMNSDVIPAHPGWIEVVLDRLKTLPPFSVIGPKLIYADDSLQHAGMYFYQLSTGYWQNFHYWKGYARHFAAADRERAVPAVTGACMIVRKADYLAVGGFTTDYIVGDYEDSDLCLKLRERAGVPLYMPQAELYHFERQSMPLHDGEQELGSALYNMALHTARWREHITALMSDMEEANVI
jgi:GT2 family glycosyltransferase